MKRSIYLLLLATFFSFKLYAQQFISKATIEFEVKANVKKTMGNNSFEEMIKENIPEFKTSYYNFTFADNKSIYKFDHWGMPRVPNFFTAGEEDNIWFADHTTGRINKQKSLFGSNLNIEDSLPELQWKFTNENRIIAGFNCRKAVAKIFDSVYVFAFYTDEIMISGGPCDINGLPGMILGLTIPRLYTSWIATKVMVNGVQEAAIKPVTAKKYYNSKFLKTTIEDRTKDWSTGPDATEEDRQQKNRYLWTWLL